MDSLEFLHRIRDHELDTVARHLLPGARILELGGGTGYQAKQLVARGFSVVSVDVATSIYRQQRVYPVLEYDGRTLPFSDGVFDVVFSSNVLEHIRDLDRIHREIVRVLKPDGSCVHVMPSPTWRLWTSVTNYLEFVRGLARTMRAVFPCGHVVAQQLSLLKGLKRVAGLVLAHAIPERHGETGNAFTELWTFSRRAWIAHFLRNRFEVVAVQPMELFYTGYMILGPRWSLAGRQRAARLLGSASVLYKLRLVMRQEPATSEADRKKGA